MTTDRWRRVDELFGEACKRPPDRRESFVAEACGDDSELRDRVVTLLKSDEAAPADFMRVAESASDATPEEPSPRLDPMIGRHVGRCRITEVIASGGMGTVYKAEQDNPRRTVAVKLMHPGVTSRFVLKHFQRESQILARLRHPHIAQVFEAGTYRPRKGDAGPAVPYFVMEYVPDARPITQYAEERGLTRRQRLELFVQVCDAVHHGHQKGVIHRDLKPGNILVEPAEPAEPAEAAADGSTATGGVGCVKVIDFGVARSTDADVAVTTMQTDVGRLIGTLQYMSPEQCAADPLELDTRSDVYALGVVLYELLTGRMPYDVGDKTIHAAARVICEEPPQRPGLIDRKLRGDLEVILLTALEKDREKRYPSAMGLGKDVQRVLAGEPIDARPPSLWTRTCHRVGRHPIAATAAACTVIAVATLLGTVFGISYGREPSHVEVQDYRRAVLWSRGGRVLHEWGSGAWGAVKGASMVREPEVLGERRLAVIGYGPYETGPHARHLCAYDVEGDPDVPVWEAVVAEDQVPEVLRKERDYRGDDFYVQFLEIADVFPDIPGVELIVAHQHYQTTHAAIRVYDLTGQVRYQIWADCTVMGLYWMAGPRRLIVAGLNGAAFWPERGHPEGRPDRHPAVVFALRTGDFITTEYVRETRGEGPLDPVWYKCLLPAEAAQPARLHLFPAVGQHDRRTHVQLSAEFTPLVTGLDVSASLSFIIDEDGKKIDKSLQLSNQYAANRDKLPDPEQLYLGDLPSIQRQPGTARPPPDRTGKTPED